MGNKLILAVVLVIAGTGVACGDGGSAPVAPSSSDGDLLIALDDRYQGSNALLTVLDVHTGETVAQFTSGYQTWALFRPSAGELLVSDLVGDDLQGRLRVYDIATTDSPKWTLPLQDRAAFTEYAPAIALSGDERYLYYVVHDRDEEGQTEGLPRRIGIVDLDEGREIARAELPAYCYALAPLGEVDVLALCGRERDLVSVTPDGSVSTLTEPLPAQTQAPDASVFWYRPVHGDVYGDGRAFIAYANGDVIFSDSEQSTTNLLPSGDRRLWGSAVWGSGEWHLDDDRALLAIGPAQPATETGIGFDTLILFDPADPRDPQQSELPPGITHATPLDAGRVALLDSAGGTIYLFDLASGQVTKELQAPSGTRWLVGP
jgi:hypothetical protein